MEQLLLAIWNLPPGLGSAIGGSLTVFGAAAVVFVGWKTWRRDDRENAELLSHLLDIIATEAFAYEKFLGGEVDKFKRLEIKYQSETAAKFGDGFDVEVFKSSFDSVLSYPSYLFDFKWQETKGIGREVLAKLLLVEKSRFALNADIRRTMALGETRNQTSVVAGLARVIEAMEVSPKFLVDLRSVVETLE